MNDTSDTNYTRSIIIIAIIATIIGLVGDFERREALSIKEGTSNAIEKDKPLESIYTDSMKMMFLARLIYSEAVSSNYIDMLSVGTVVFNRWENDSFNKSRWEDIEDVIIASGQFHGYGNPKFNIDLDNCKPSHKKAFALAMKASHKLLDGYRHFDQTVLYYFNPLKATNTKFIEWAEAELKLVLVNQGTGREVHHYYAT